MRQTGSTFNYSTRRNSCNQSIEQLIALYCISLGSLLSVLPERYKPFPAQVDTPNKRSAQFFLMKRKKTLADFWTVIFLVAAGLMFYFDRLEPQADIAWGAIAAFFAAIGWSKWKLKEFFSNQSARR
jgi:hypothetical protein